MRTAAEPCWVAALKMLYLLQLMTAARGVWSTATRCVQAPPGLQASQLQILGSGCQQGELSCSSTGSLHHAVTALQGVRQPPKPMACTYDLAVCFEGVLCSCGQPHLGSLACTYTCCSLPEPPSACQSRQQLQFSSLLQRFCCRRCCNAEAGVELPYYFGGRPLAMHVCLVGCAQPHARNLLQCNIVRAAPSRLAAGAQHSQSVACMPQLFSAAHCQQMYALFTVTFKTCMLSISWQLRCCWH